MSCSIAFQRSPLGQAEGSPLPGLVETRNERDEEPTVREPVELRQLPGEDHRVAPDRHDVGAQLERGR